MVNEINIENIKAILSAGINTRFQNLTPIQFEELSCLLFSQIYETAELTKSTADYGCDVYCTDKNGDKIVIQCKRYQKGKNIGNKYIDNTISAKLFYEAKKGIIVTTSDFTENAKIIAKKAEIELWNWDKLVNKLSIHLNEGEPILKNKLDTKVSQYFRCRISSIDSNFTEKKRYAHFITVEIENLTDKMFDLATGSPTLINNQKQYDLDLLWEGYFTKGKIFPYATVTAGYIFDQDKIGDLDFDNLILYLEVMAHEEKSILEHKTVSLDATNLDEKTDINHEIDENESNIGCGSIINYAIVILFILILIALIADS